VRNAIAWAWAGYRCADVAGAVFEFVCSGRCRCMMLQLQTEQQGWCACMRQEEVRRIITKQRGASSTVRHRCCCSYCNIVLCPRSSQQL
jgi:hypothetical protein